MQVNTLTMQNNLQKNTSKWTSIFSILRTLQYAKNAELENKMQQYSLLFNIICSICIYAI